eukprot:1553734-Amphidinium_carterae.1
MLVPNSFSLHVNLASRSDICSLRWHMDRRGCTEAVVEHLGWLLYPKFVHYSFTVAAMRIVKVGFGLRGMTLKDAT